MSTTPVPKEGKTQPSVKDYIIKNSRTDSPNNQSKKRTPPSPTKPPQNKKKYIESMEFSEDMDATSSNSNEEIETASDSEDEEMPELDEKSALLQRAITIAMNKNMKKQLKKRLKPIKRDVNSLLDMKSNIEQHQQEITSIKAENKELKSMCTRMEREHNKLVERIEKLEDKRLECNLIFNGIHETPWETDEELLEKIYGAMATTVNKDTEEQKLKQVKKVKIISVRRLGKAVERRKRPVQVIFDKPTESATMMLNKKKLPKGIYVDQEYSPETEKARRQLRPILNAARRCDEFKQKCKLEGDTLVINSKKYTTVNLHELPKELSGYNLNGKSNDHVVAFFGALNPFSNFHPCTFKYEDTTYNCSEQFIQAKKALYFKDTECAAKILAAKNGPDCKRLSKEIKNYSHDQWKQAAKHISEPGITAKFLQNPDLLRTLESTKGKALVESCNDTLWGTGIPLHSNDALEKTKWKNTGIMGEILMNIRESWGSCAIMSENGRAELQQQYPHVFNCNTATGSNRPKNGSHATGSNRAKNCNATSSNTAGAQST